MSEGDGSAVDIHLVLGDVEHSCRPERDSGIRLIDLDQVQIGRLHSGFLESDHQCLGRAFVERGVDASNLSVGKDFGNDRCTGRLSCVVIGDHHGGGTIRNLGGVAGGDRAG